MSVMEVVEFYFRASEDSADQIRRYEVDSFEEAISKFHQEFPDENTRPRIFRVRTEKPT